MGRRGASSSLADSTGIMTDHDRDRETERQRYNERAARQLSHEGLGPDGAESIAPTLRRPYLVLEQLILEYARPGSSVLDLCCGDGVHSLIAIRAGANVTASDIAENNLQAAAARAARAGVRLSTLLANAEQLPLPDASFDLVTCVGSLSYVDHALFLREVRRVLRPGGAFIFVDSLNHNPVYRLNRWLHYRQGRRSLSTLQRMPTMNTLQRIRRDFPDLRVSYHGIFSFLIPLLGWFDPHRAGRWLDQIDLRLLWLRRYSFKIVGVGHKPSAG